MLIRIRYLLRDHEDESVKGTLSVVDGDIDFRKTDGFIRFMMTATEQSFQFYGKQDPEWIGLIKRLYETASMLKDENVKFTGSTREEFEQYCKSVSELPETIHPIMKAPCIMTRTSDDLIPFMKECVGSKVPNDPRNACRDIAFLYEPKEDAEKGLREDLMHQLSNLKFEKPQRDYDVSWCLTKAGYHEHVHDALNLVMQGAVYAMNCRSSRDCRCYPFDVLEVERTISAARAIIKNTAHVI